MSVKVLHVAQSSEYGLARYLDMLLAAQQSDGWPVTMVGDPASELRPSVVARGIPWIDWVASRDPGRSVVDETRALREIVEGNDPDVVHLHSSKAGLVGRFAVRDKTPTIFQPHAWSFFAVSGPKKLAAIRWERYAAGHWTDTIVCGSQAEMDQGRAARIKPPVYRVVPNAVDTDRFSPAPRRHSDGPVVVCAARLAIAQKGQDVLLQAWPMVVAAVPGVRLVLVGEGPDRAMLEAAAGPSVEFAGGSDDMPSWFRQADLVVAPSRYETLSLSVLEALACGKSVVASDAVGMREAVGDAGAVVPIGDAESLATAMITRLRDPELAHDEGRRGRERVVARYGLPAWHSTMFEVTVVAASRKA